MLANEATTSQRQPVEKAGTLITGALKHKIWLLNSQSSSLEIATDFWMFSWLGVSRFGLPGRTTQNDRRIVVINRFKNEVTFRVKRHHSLFPATALTPKRRCLFSPIVPLAFILSSSSVPRLNRRPGPTPSSYLDHAINLIILTSPPKSTGNGSAAHEWGRVDCRATRNLPLSYRPTVNHRATRGKGLRP